MTPPTRTRWAKTSCLRRASSLHRPRRIGSTQQSSSIPCPLHRAPAARRQDRSCGGVLVRLRPLLQPEPLIKDWVKKLSADGGASRSCGIPPTRPTAACITAEALGKPMKSARRIQGHPCRQPADDGRSRHPSCSNTACRRWINRTFRSFSVDSQLKRQGTHGDTGYGRSAGGQRSTPLTGLISAAIRTCWLLRKNGPAGRQNDPQLILPERSAGFFFQIGTRASARR